MSNFKLKYIIGDIIEYKNIQYRVDGVYRDQYSLTFIGNPDDDSVHQRKGWKVDKDAIPISLAPRPKPVSPVSEKAADSIWNKLKFWT